LPQDISGLLPAPQRRRYLPASRRLGNAILTEYSLRRKISQAVLDMHRAPTDPDSVYDALMSNILKLPEIKAAGIWRVDRDGTWPLLLHRWPEGVSYDDNYLSLVSLNCSSEIEESETGIAVAALLPEGSSAAKAVQRIMCVLSRHAAIALAQRFKVLASQRTAGSLEVLNHIGNKIISSLNLADLFHTIYDELRQIMTANVFYVALYHSETQEVEMAFVYEEGRSVKPFRFPLNDGPVSRVIKSQDPVLYNLSLKEIPQAILFGQQPSEIKCLMMAPMITKGRVVGALSAQSYHKGDYSEQDLQLLTTVASQAAVAVENSRMYENTLQQASTDAMTGLWNRQAFFAHLDRIIASADQPKHELALIMIDSDSLKEINDKLGHSAGDEHIAQMARVIKSCVRSRDAVCRYGGDEFLVLLQKKSAQEAAEVAQRIIDSIASEGLLEDNSVRVTASAGISTYPGCAADSAALFQAADAAVYMAKRQGKNRVCVAKEADRNEVRLNES
jgi:diguanylate cyclase (GGDEF)-like protein